MLTLAPTPSYLELIYVIFRPDMEEAKEVHKCLRTAAGIFSYVKVRCLGMALGTYILPNTLYRFIALDKMFNFY